MKIQQKIKYDADVIIAGGGPAGSGLAYHLATAGIKVLVIEAAVFPRDKVCGDGVSPIAVAELQKMGITQTKKFAKANEINKVGLHIKGDKVFIDLQKPDYLSMHARIIPRIELDNWLYEAAKKAGAKYLQNTRVVSYSTQSNGAFVQVKTNRDSKTLSAKMIIGADGSSSLIARQLHGAKPSTDFQLLGLRAYYNGIEGAKDRVDIFFEEHCFPGIFWMFPKGSSGANVGMAMVSETLPKSEKHVHQILKDHIASNAAIKEGIGNGKLVGKILGWPIRFFNPDNALTANRLLLVGDAAGLINPLSGDGVQYSLLSASWAADTIKDCIAQDDFSAVALHNYRIRVEEEVGYDFALSNLLVQFPRNKSLTPIWMAFVELLIEKAKKDPKYAATIAGIFEGTYPSFDVLTPSFLLKTLQQAGLTAGGAALAGIQNPKSIMDAGSRLVKGIKDMATVVKGDPKAHKKWLGNTLSNMLTVGKYTWREKVKPSIVKAL